MAVADGSALDTAAVVRFAASVVWRAGISTAIDQVELAPRHETVLRNFLLADHEDTQAPDTLFFVVELIAPEAGLPIDQVVIMPYGGLNEEVIFLVYRFAVFGFIFCVVLGALVPDNFDEICFARTKRVLLSDGRVLLPHLAEMFQKVEATGGVRRSQKARRRPPSR